VQLVAEGADAHAEDFRGVRAIAFATGQGGKNGLLFQLREGGEVREGTSLSAEDARAVATVAEVAPSRSPDRPKCSGSNMPFSPHKITARSTTFCNSRT